MVLAALTGCVGFNDGSPGWRVGPFRQHAVPDQVVPPTQGGSTALPQTRRGTRSAPALASEAPVPIGPPLPGRRIGIPLRWTHNPAEDGAAEYWLYWSRSPDRWDSRTNLPVVLGQRYLWQTSTPGFARFAVTAARPPRAEEGETQWQESDPSNEVRINVSGFPRNPEDLQRVR